MLKTKSNPEIEMSMSRFAMPLLFFASLPGVAAAHPGHGNHRDGNSFLHYATSPIHLLPLLAAAVVVACLAFCFRSLIGKAARIIL